MIYNAITELEDEEKDYYRYYLEEHLEKTNINDTMTIDMKLFWYNITVK